jgi:hypothetical protein
MRRITIVGSSASIHHGQSIDAAATFEIDLI